MVADRCFKLEVELHRISLLEACVTTCRAPNVACRKDKPMPASAAVLVMPFLPASGEGRNRVHGLLWPVSLSLSAMLSFCVPPAAAELKHNLPGLD
jgi:hypothetical protein